MYNVLFLKWIMATNLKLFPAISNTYLSLPMASQLFQVFFTSANCPQSLFTVLTYHSLRAPALKGYRAMKSRMTGLGIMTILHQSKVDGEISASVRIIFVGFVKVEKNFHLRKKF